MSAVTHTELRSVRKRAVYGIGAGIQGRPSRDRTRGARALRNRVGQKGVWGGGLLDSTHLGFGSGRPELSSSHEVVVPIRPIGDDWHFGTA